MRNSRVDFRQPFGCCLRGPLQGRGSRVRAQGSGVLGWSGSWEAEAPLLPALLTLPRAWGLWLPPRVYFEKEKQIKGQ